MNKALIIIDIQNDYFQNGAYPLVGSEEASLNAKLILEECRKKSIPVIHIQHLSMHEGATFFIPNTEGVKIHSNVEPIENESVINKLFPNSFLGTDLQAHLESLNINELIVCGMMTSMCVDATVRAAKDLGYNCLVISDACAAPNLEYNGVTTKGEDVHNAFIAALNYYYATVVTTKEFINL